MIEIVCGIQVEYEIGVEFYRIIMGGEDRLLPAFSVFGVFFSCQHYRHKTKGF